MYHIINQLCRNFRASVSSEWSGFLPKKIRARYIITPIEVSRFFCYYEKYHYQPINNTSLCLKNPHKIWSASAETLWRRDTRNPRKILGDFFGRR